MAQWGREDQSVTANSTTTIETSNGAPIGTYTLVKGDQVGRVDGANAHLGNTSPGSRANTDVNMFGNTTVGAFIPNMAVGVFGVDVTEVGVDGGPLAETFILTGGSGYTANAVVTVTFANGTTNATAVNAFANVSSATLGGSITELKIAQAGSGIKLNPTITVAAPSAINITANTTGVDNATDFIKIASANVKFQAGDRFYYGVPASNTAIGGMTGNTYYYVSFANSTGVCVADTAGGANLDLTALTTNPAEVHTATGDTATGYVVVSGGKNKGIAHAGWNVRREGTGGRAGRVQYETLVAMGSLGDASASVGDASDDTILPDS
jgi:hypothetical protein